MSKPKFVFFGSPEFASIILERLISAGFVPAAVICNPDRPFGRKKIITPPPVKAQIANRTMPAGRQESQIAILQPEKIDAAFAEQLREINPDFAVVAAYAKILPEEVVGLPRLGTIGVHPSLLPKFRGATPIQSAILSGDTETGISLYVLDARVDHGPVLASSRVTIEPEETTLSLSGKLARLSGELLIQFIPRFISGKISPIIQDEARATFTKKFTTEDGFVDFVKDDATTIDRKIRALNPEPGVYTFVNKGGKSVRMKILEANLVDDMIQPTVIQYEGEKPTRLKT